jgi:hypothetical protein
MTFIAIRQDSRKMIFDESVSTKRWSHNPLLSWNTQPEECKLQITHLPSGRTLDVSMKSDVKMN